MSAPYHTDSYKTAADRGPVAPYAPLGLRAKLAIASLLIGIVIDAVAVYLFASYLSLINRFFSDDQTAPALLRATEGRLMIIGGVGLLVSLITVVTFLIWMYQAHRNLPATGAHNLEYSPGWAIGGFFVPILNLLRPFQVMREIWKASDPDQESVEGDYWKYSDTTPALGFWWFACLGAGFISIVSFIMAWSIAWENELSSLSLAALANRMLTATLLKIVSEILRVIAAVLAILLIKGITARQEEKMSRAPAAMPPPENPPYGYSAPSSAAAP